MTTGNKRKALVWGAGGFVGGELVRLLAVHPLFELKAALSSTSQGKLIKDIYPGLAPWTDLAFSDPSSFRWEDLRSGAWTVFCSLGHGESMKEIPRVLEIVKGADVRLVDLSGDFRLKDANEYRNWYGREHTAPGYIGRFVYGLPEMKRDEIAGARLVSNPGCLATGAQLAIAAAASSGARVRAIAIDAKTGSSGAGIKPRETTHHPNRMNNFRAYMVLAHQHTPEIVGGWRAAGGSSDVDISFVPQMAPMVRGIFTTAHIFSEEPVAAEEARGWYEEYYSGAPFVRIVDGSPAVADVWGTNRCDISIAAEGRKIVVCTAIDNLVKGAAGQAVQNANIMNGWDETAGLVFPAPAPV